VSSKAGRLSGMARWREVLFAFMHHYAQRPGSTRCGIDWSIPPEQQADRPPAPPEDKRQLYGPINMMG
jgi:hypothetical protein